MRVTSSLSCPKYVVGSGLPFAAEAPFVYEPLLSAPVYEFPFATFPRGDLGPEEREEPFVKLCEGDRGCFDVSLSRRIVPSCPRLRFALRREGPARLCCSCSVLSSSSSLSDALCLRFRVACCSVER